jgi:anaerobic ribonucleoside-triphosphate reductase activating protein
MLKFYNYDIVCQEIPDEITLAVNITGCPNRCQGCHSPWLQQDIGAVLTEKSLCEIINKYKSGITCVCFMGGDGEPEEVLRLADFIKAKYPCMKTGWYSGNDSACMQPNGSFRYTKIDKLPKSCRANLSFEEREGNKSEINLSIAKLSEYFNFIKTGSYIEKAGGLRSPDTNQRLYKIEREKYTRISLAGHFPKIDL